MSDDGRHSDPYPKMPWESGDGGGTHRDPSGARAKGCFGIVSVPVIAILFALAMVLDCVWW